MIKNRVTLTKLTPDMWRQEHIDSISKFLGPVDSYPQILTAYVDSVNGLILANSMPYGSVGEMVYFIRRRVSDTEATEPHVTVKSFFSEIHYGVVSGRHIESLLRVMTGVYVPMFFHNTAWPDRSRAAHCSCAFSCCQPRR